jgi:hypothetical protein
VHAERYLQFVLDVVITGQAEQYMRIAMQRFYGGSPASGRTGAARLAGSRLHVSRVR